MGLLDAEGGLGRRAHRDKSSFGNDFAGCSCIDAHRRAGIETTGNAGTQYWAIRVEPELFENFVCHLQTEHWWFTDRIVMRYRRDVRTCISSASVLGLTEKQARNLFDHAEV